MLLEALDLVNTLEDYLSLWFSFPKNKTICPSDKGNESKTTYSNYGSLPLAP
ncbi:Uncharacterised protein [Legionella cherrii]|uniref:Uncharacterized protein n=1 Tax=Legionella cherrii TaxID=28084 RepID=A0A0W0SHU5_9GAMM|nr:hypothetical protein Lche_0733 [Legionella cherrii]VEB39417.1 Uncharacterised protein [Legionella cherrii]